MLGVCSASCRGDGAPWGSGSQAERLRGDAEAMPHPRENGSYAQEGRTTLGLNSALPGRLWIKIKAVAIAPQRKAQRFAHVAAREQRP